MPCDALFSLLHHTHVEIGIFRNAAIQTAIADRWNRKNTFKASLYVFFSLNLSTVVYYWNTIVLLEEISRNV